MNRIELQKIYGLTIDKIQSTLVDSEIDKKLIYNIMEFDGIPLEYRDKVFDIAIVKTFGNPKYHN